MWLVLLVEIVTYSAASVYAYPRYMKENDQRDKILRVLIAAGYWLTDELRITERMPETIGKLHQLMTGLYGARAASVKTKHFIASSLSICCSVMCAGTLLACTTGSWAEMSCYGALGVLAAPLLRYKLLSDRLKLKKRRMLLELPELVGELIVLINAGETVQQALIRSVERRRATAGPLLMELGHVVQSLRMNASFPKSMEEFNKQCAMQEVSVFTTTLLLNYKRGGEELVMSLRELSTSLWDKRKALARTLGEEASSKLVFPMVLIFFVVMAVVAAPAFMLMN